MKNENIYKNCYCQSFFTIKITVQPYKKGEFNVRTLKVTKRLHIFALIIIKKDKE